MDELNLNSMQEREETQGEISVAKAEREREDPLHMTLFIDEVTPRRLHLSLPVYRKHGRIMVKILSPSEYIEVTESSYRHEKGGDARQFFDGQYLNYTDCEETDFNHTLILAYDKLTFDLATHGLNK